VIYFSVFCLLAVPPMLLFAYRSQRDFERFMVEQRKQDHDRLYQAVMESLRQEIAVETQQNEADSMRFEAEIYRESEGL